MEKTILFFASGYQLEIASGLGIGFVCHSPLSAGSPSGPDLSRPCACFHILCEFIYALVLLWLEGRVSLSSGERDGFNGDSPFRDECSKVCHSLYIA